MLFSLQNLILSIELPLDEYPHLANEIMERIAKFITQNDPQCTQAFMTGWDRNRTQQLFNETSKPTHRLPASNSFINPGFKCKTADITQLTENESEDEEDNVESKPKRFKKERPTPQSQPCRSVRLASKRGKRKAMVLAES
ncbi:MAG: hypothetical protein BGO43_00540 [Gammaproteobacteria bacterium 39-13]|nr:hypothetical protein [Gammaproteobacteria bacterium]OJV96745.1 MAG: hypothetical protein BGO43_00540 [Gammaproteobacteria bacterium 39-13]